MNWTESLTHEKDSIIASQKHTKQFGVMVKEPDCQASDLGSIPGQVSEFFVNLILLNSSD